MNRMMLIYSKTINTVNNKILYIIRFTTLMCGEVSNELLSEVTCKLITHCY